MLILVLAEYVAINGVPVFLDRGEPLGLSIVKEPLLGRFNWLLVAACEGGVLEGVEDREVASGGVHLAGCVVLLVCLVVIMEVDWLGLYFGNLMVKIGLDGFVLQTSKLTNLFSVSGHVFVLPFVRGTIIIGVMLVSHCLVLLVTQRNSPASFLNLRSQGVVSDLVDKFRLRRFRLDLQLWLSTCWEYLWHLELLEHLLMTTWRS